MKKKTCIDCDMASIDKAILGRYPDLVESILKLLRHYQSSWFTRIRNGGAAYAIEQMSIIDSKMSAIEALIGVKRNIERGE